MQKMIVGNGHELITRLINHPSERPFCGIVRNFSIGLIIGIGLTVVKLFSERIGWDSIFANLFCGWCLSFAGWGAERLWYSVLAPMMRNPFSWYAFLSRIPLWWMAGAIAYTVGMLVSKKSGLFEVHDIPVNRIFFFGGIAGMVVQTIMQWHLYKFIKRNYSFELYSFWKGYP